MAPLPADAFMDAVFDDRPLLVSRPDSPRYYAPWFSRAVIDDLLRHALLMRLRNSISCSSDSLSNSVVDTTAAASRLLCSTLPHTRQQMNCAEVW